MAKEAKNNGNKIAKKAAKVARIPSFATFVKKTSGGIYSFNQKRNIISIKDGLVWRDAKEEGRLADFVREYHKACLTK